jgi:hypothetical protein
MTVGIDLGTSEESRRRGSQTLDFRRGAFQDFGGAQLFLS